MGKAAGVAAIILAGGTHGKRFAFPNSRIMLTKIFGSLESAATDIETVVQESITLKTILTAIIGQAFDRIDRDTGNYFLLFADEALANGFVDAVLHPQNTRTSHRGQIPLFARSTVHRVRNRRVVSPRSGCIADRDAVRALTL